MNTHTNSKELLVSVSLRYYFNTGKIAPKYLYDEKELLSKNNCIPNLKWYLTILASLSRIHALVYILSKTTLVGIT